MDSGAGTLGGWEWPDVKPAVAAWERGRPSSAVSPRFRRLKLPKGVSLRYLRHAPNRNSWTTACMRDGLHEE